jgi:hypothetical protein
MPVKGYKIRDKLHPLEKVQGRKDAEDGGTSNILLPGPYFASIMDGRLMPAYRVYEDTFETFIQVSLLFILRNSKTIYEYIKDLGAKISSSANDCLER